MLSHFLLIYFCYSIFMKKILLFTFTLLVLFITILPANEKENYAFVSFYELRGESTVHMSDRSATIFKDINVTFALLKSNDTALTIHNIQTKDTYFEPVDKSEKFQDTNVTYWMRVDMGKSFPEGDFILSYGDAQISEETLSQTQSSKIFSIDHQNFMTFSYKKNDISVYYFKLKPQHFKEPFRYLSITVDKDFYKGIAEGFDMQLFLGMILGVILMAAIYNGAMYFYNRHRSFLYYTLMQLSMFALLLDYSGIFVYDQGSFFCRNRIYESLISLTTALFATLFTIKFLDIEKYLPKLYVFLRFTTGAIVADMVLSIFYKSLIHEFYLYPFFMLPFLYAGYRRVKDGYKPARFYLAGWILFTASVFLNVFHIGYKYYTIDPLYIGSAIEAILFSLALSYKMRMVAKEKEEQRGLLVHQSKLASMGEMLGNISHQWRQPLSHIGLILMNIKESSSHKELNETYLNKKLDEASTQVEYMSQTVEDFAEFYAPEKEKEDFMFSLATKETLEIMSHTFNKNHIEVKLNIINDFTLHSYKNEYKQVMLNLLSNAKDALADTPTRENITNPRITVTINGNTVSISDNGIGMKKSTLKRIFEPYFTTKEKNSGIGLYMSKMIIERSMNGKISAESGSEGSTFTLSF